ncbi:MAG: FAD-dependent thymidylate synthase [Candidatus Neomarinimicrobiota bacterium]
MSDHELPAGAIACLDKGFVRLVDSMGSDAAIVQAARVSYGKGTTKVSRDRALIRYLMRHHHSSPFEMVELKFHAKMPIFVARQWVRHRTANINEYSLRYSEALDEFYIPRPEDVHFQSLDNKQGREAAEVPQELRQRTVQYFEEMSQRSFALYNELAEAGIARELARAILPVNLYTQWYWKNDLHNTFHFLRLRMDQHAQYEIRVYADAMAGIIRGIVPLAYEAFEDYILSGLFLSRLDRELFSRKLPERIITDLHEDVAYRIVASVNSGKPRTVAELYRLYREEGGGDDADDFAIKWSAAEPETGNIYELRELAEKLNKFN